MGNLVAAGTLGAVGELICAADLMRRQFEVYRALSPSASCDLAVLLGSRVLRIEVRTGHCAENRERPTCNWGEFDRNKGADVLAIVVQNPMSVTYLDPRTGRTPSKMREFDWYAPGDS